MNSAWFKGYMMALSVEEVRCSGEGCENYHCQDCCYHEFDYEEGGMCLHCGADGYEHNADNYDEGDR